ncbi:MAG TPA: peptidylprolyl isomerase, partial [Bacteroidota bacterium]|nr:peptidylprolyl isomerase [Bacteroidota bacterium]
MMRSTVTAALLALLAGFAPAQQAPPGAVIARAGDIFISEREFLERYEMLPAFGRHRPSQVESAKLELLYSIAAEKLLAQDAAAGGLERDTAVRAGLLETAKLFARDELYKHEVIQKVRLTEKEIDQGIAKAELGLAVRYLFCPREEDARFIRSQIRGAADMRRLQVDSSFHAIRDTATLLWGDADARIEDAAYRLKRGEVSPVVAAGDGYYILTVTRVGRNPYYAAMAPDVLRAKVVTILRRRKEHERLDEFLEEALRGKVGFALPRPAESLALALEKVYADPGMDSVVYLTPERESRLEHLEAAELSDTLAVAGSRVWSVGEFIPRLAGEG